MSNTSTKMGRLYKIAITDDGFTAVYWQAGAAAVQALETAQADQPGAQASIVLDTAGQPISTIEPADPHAWQLWLKTAYAHDGTAL